MAEAEDSEHSERERESLAPPGLAECLLSDTGPECRVGALQVEREGGEVLSCQIIGVALVDGGYLVAVPHAAWHRVGARRYLPPDSLTRPTLAEVLAASAVDRRQAHPVWKVKTWLGVLNPALVTSVVFSGGGEATAFGAADEGAEIVFTVAGSGGTAGGPSPACPLGQSLSAIAAEHFSFHSAQEFLPEEDLESRVPARLEAVESAIGELKAGIQTLLARGAGGEPAPAAPARQTRVGGLPSRTPAPTVGGPPLAGLDPAVLRSARMAGVPEAQLEKMSQLVQGARRLPAEPKGPAVDPLDDEPLEDDAEVHPGKDGGGELHQAVVQMSRILSHMHKEKKPSSLEDVLDRAEGGSDLTGASSSSGRSKAAAYQRLRSMLRTNPAEISKSIESCMQDDFAHAQSGPGLDARPCSARAWIEHRSLLQSFNGPVRQAWTLGGIIDALNNGDAELAKATALLALAGLDQAAIDSGSWLLASEIALEPSPPFGAFSRPRTLDPFEARQTRLLDPRWISILMGRIKERDAYHTAKKNLGGGGAGNGAPGPSVPPGGRGDGQPTETPGDPKDGKGGRKGPKGGGRGDKGNKKEVLVPPLRRVGRRLFQVPLILMVWFSPVRLPTSFASGHLIFALRSRRRLVMSPLQLPCLPDSPSKPTSVADSVLPAPPSALLEASCGGTTDASAASEACPGPRNVDACKAVPGTRATPVTASRLWEEWFGALSSSDCSLSIFFHSLRELPRRGRGPHGDSAQSRRKIWPMPLPYPELLLPGNSTRDAERLSLNALVLVLNWLFLGQPAVCRADHEIKLGRDLHPRQWQRVEALRSSVQRWNATPTVGPSEMGRAAAKFEALEDLLSAISRGFGELRLAGRSLEGAVRMKLSRPCHALPVDCDRIKFVGEPSFDPRPYLDNYSRAIYENPSAFRVEIPEGVPIPRAQVRTAPGKRLGLLQALDKCKRLKVFPSSQVRTPYRNGLFAVPKDEARDRLVLDARVPNMGEGGEDPWIQSLGSVEQLQHAYLPPTHEIRVYCEDLREFYHAFLISTDRCQRNALAVYLTREEAATLSCACQGTASELMVPCLDTLAMGDTHAVSFGQTSHLAVLLRWTRLRLKDFLTLKGRPPRSPNSFAGLLIDDFIYLDFVEKGKTDRPSLGQAVIEEVRAGYEATGLPRHAGKAVYGESQAEFWGALFDGERGLIRPNPKRVVPLAFLLVRIVRQKACCGSLLEAVSGALVSALQVRRRLLSLLDSVYGAQRGVGPSDAFLVRGPLASELLCSAALLCLSEVDIRAEGAPMMICSDASSVSEAAVCSDIPPGVSVELCRHGLQKGLWNRLLGEVPAYLRERGDDDLGVGELPESHYEHHPMLEALCSFLPFRQFGPVLATHKRHHINVGEIRAALRAEAGLGRRFPGTRYLHLLDSQVATACLVKGRSSSRALNFELRRSLADHLTLRTQPRYGFVRSKFNPADDPTRAVDVRKPAAVAPAWWGPACQGDFGPLDSWLTSIGLHLDQLRDLPDERELGPDASFSLPGLDRGRRGRRAQDPESVASRILRRAVIGSADLLVLFDRLPAQVSDRSALEKQKGLTFNGGAFVHGGVVGLLNSCGTFPRAVRAFCLYIRQVMPGMRFSSFSVLANTKSLPHKDSHNLEGHPNLIVPLSRFRGGEVWIETTGGSVPLQWKGRTVHGELLDVSRGACVLEHHRLHATMPWRGRRCVLVAFTVRDLWKLSENQRESLEALGFNLPDSPAPAFSPTPSLTAAGSPEPGSSSLSVDGSPRVEPLSASVSGSSRVELLRPSGLNEASRRFSAPRPGLTPKSSPLSPAILDLLRSLPPGRFVFSEVFPDLSSALLHGRGWLDLFSGSRGFAKELARAAPCWILCYDVLHGSDEDLLDCDVQKPIKQLLEGGAFEGFSAGPVCASFSCAITPPWRSSEYPAGKPNLTAAQWDKVREGNAMLDFVLELVIICDRGGLLYLIENPLGSWMWRQEGWKRCLARGTRWDFAVDFCTFGTPWKKPTRFRTNGQLGGQHLRCSRDHQHLRLRGRDPATKSSRTKLGEPYPRRLCVLLAQATCQDAGWADYARPLDISRCAKCTNARIGEARVPGPPRRKARAPLILRDVPLVEPATLALQTAVWSGFSRWLHDGAGAVAAEIALSCPDILVEMLCAYGQVLYSEGAPLQNYRQLLATAQRRVPGCRPLLKPGWEMLTRWERLEPVQHRPPLPEPIFEAMCCLGFCWGWKRWVCITLVAFYGCCRIGEVLRAKRSDLQTPKDLLRTDFRFFLKIREPKTRFRGPRTQHVALVLPSGIAEFISSVCDAIPPSEGLYHGSPSVYRRRWDYLLERLGVARTFKLTPGSLRGGGAVAAYQGGLDIPSLQWRMRLQHQATLAFYLQEVAAGSVLPSLPRHSREAIEAARAVFPFLFNSAQRAIATPARL
ncbi:unnamed protein product [Symbiodinium sp. CCMP2592]|nr:unnamed protein product [Symbiodinium sp. CCMP2592]